MAYFRMNTWSNNLKYQTELNVYIPDSLDLSEEQDVFLGFHGLCGNHTDFEKYNIEKYAEENKFVLVFPSTHNSYYLNTKTGEKFSDYVGVEIFDILRNTFGIKVKNKCVIGISMGGYGAVMIGLKYKFDFIANLSGSVIIENRVKNTDDDRFYNIFDEVTDDIKLTELIGKYQPKKLYTYCGTNDFLWEDNKYFNEFVLKYCKDNKIVIDDGDHSFDCWFNQFEQIFKYYGGMK